MTADPPPPDDDPPDPDEAELVAFLDGELDAADARQVESRLALDAQARARADALKKSFDLLDYLPRPEPSADFTNRTISRLQPALTGSADGSAASGPAAVVPSARSGSVANVPAAGPAPWRAAVGWLAAAVVAVAVGYGTHAGLRAAGVVADAPDELPLRDLRVIESLPLYLGADDLGFVRRLDDPDLFGADADPADPPPAASPPAAAGGRDALIELFKAYPPARRQQLRDLDQQLADLPAADRGRLLRVLERYAVWLDRLADADRAAVLSAPDADARLDAVRRVRERTWRDALPARQRELLKRVATPEEAVQVAAGWKAAARGRQEEWALARRQWDELARGPAKPWPFGDPALASQADAFVRDVFKADLSVRGDGRFDLPAACRLTRDEFVELKTRHEAATKEGYWLLYGACLLRLADRHPYLPPPASGPPLADPSQVSKELMKELRARKQPEVFKARGKWPEFALELADAARRAKVDLTPPGPARPGEFPPAVGRFLAADLRPALTPDEAAGLAKLEGRWPDYPQRLVELARDKDLSVPGVTLPGRPSLWRKYYGAK